MRNIIRFFVDNKVTVAIYQKGYRSLPLDLTEEPDNEFSIANH